MRESMYVEDYLDAVNVKPVTPGTFLAKTLRGKARDYQGRYLSSLMHALKARVARGAVMEIPSIGNGIAYCRVDMREGIDNS